MSESDHEAAPEAPARVAAEAPAPFAAEATAGATLEGWVTSVAALSASGGLTPGRARALHRAAGNRAVGRLLRSVAPPEPGSESAGAPTLVTDETVGELIDQLEPVVRSTAQEALGSQWSVVGCPWLDHWLEVYRARTAQEVMEAIRTYAPAAAAATTREELVAAVAVRVREGIAQWRSSGSVGEVAAGGVLARTPTDAAKVRAGLSAGRPLAPGARERFGSAFGRDFSDVRVHDAPSDSAVVAGLDARAITVGSDIAFARGEYAPGTPVGDVLLAHELAHVVQHDGAVLARWGSDAAAEAEADADRAAFEALTGGRARPRLRTGLALRRCSTDKAPAPGKTDAGPAQTADGGSPAPPPAPAPVTDWPALVDKELTDADRAALKPFVETRNAIPIHPSLSKQGDVVSYAGKGEQTSTDRLVMLYLNEIRAGEAGVSGVVSNDGTMSFGMGFATLFAKVWIRKWFDKDPSAEAAYLRAGATVRNVKQPPRKAGDKPTYALEWVVIDDGAPSKVLTYDQATQFMRKNKRLQSLHISLTEASEHQDLAGKAQLALIEDWVKGLRAKIPHLDDWTDEQLSCLFHLNHWLPAGMSGPFASTGGDAVAMAKAYAIGLYKNNLLPSDPKKPSTPALVVGASNMTAAPITHYFDDFGKGAGRAAKGYLRRGVEAKATVLNMSVNEVLQDPAFDGHVIYVVDGKSGEAPPRDQKVKLLDLGPSGIATGGTPAPAPQGGASDAGTPDAGLAPGPPPAAPDGGAPRAADAGAGALARAVLARAARAEQPPLARRILARDTDADAGDDSWDPFIDWSDEQTDWQVLVQARDAVTAAKDGAKVSLGGDNSIDVTVGADSRAGVQAAARWRLMELLYDQKSTLDTKLAAAHDMGKSTDANSRAGIQAAMRTSLAPIYTALRAGKPQDAMFEYPKDAYNATQIIHGALATAELFAEGAAEDWLPKAAGAHAAAQNALGWHQNSEHDEKYYEGLEWCGAFASTNLLQSGLDRSWPSHLVNTAPAAAGNLDGLFLYLDAVEIQTEDGGWQDLIAYHAERGSMRALQVLPGSGERWDKDTRDYQSTGAAKVKAAQLGDPTRRLGMIASIDALECQPGDMVLVDNNAGTYGDHIAMCRSYDKTSHTLWTIGGNEDKDPSRSVKTSDAKQLDSNPAPAFAANFGEKPSRVYAVGSFSVVDFEVHRYRPAKKPAKS